MEEKVVVSWFPSSPQCNG